MNAWGMVPPALFTTMSIAAELAHRGVDELAMPSRLPRSPGTTIASSAERLDLGRHLGQLVRGAGADDDVGADLGEGRWRCGRRCHGRRRSRSPPSRRVGRDRGSPDFPLGRPPACGPRERRSTLAAARAGSRDQGRRAARWRARAGVEAVAGPAGAVTGHR